MAKLDVKTVLAAARSGWSGVERYFWDHYGDLEKDLNAYGVDWDSMARVFAVEKVLDSKGNPPTPTTLRRSWDRTVQRRTGEKKQRRKSRVNDQSLSREFSGKARLKD